MDSPASLLITGASVRAAAYSALRAGFEPVCADLYADGDLKAIAPVERISLGRPIPEVVESFVAFAKSQPPGPWLYTGTFENYPDAVDEIGATHRLLGNPGATLRRVRDPFQLADCLRRAGLPAPELSRGSRGLPGDGSWLVKPLASGGGGGIEVLADQRRTAAVAVYYQRRIPGRAHSAIYLGSNGRARMIGISRQLHGIAGKPFLHRGNIGPLRLSPEIEAELVAVGHTLAAEFGLVGIFGVDFVPHAGHPWVLELNPRYTASVELFELARRSPLLLEHLRVCESEKVDSGEAVDGRSRFEDSKVIGKWVLHASRRFTFPELPKRWPSRDDLYRVPDIADVPEAGMVIDRGEPVMTVFAEGDNPASCASNLRSNISRWRQGLNLG